MCYHALLVCLRIYQIQLNEGGICSNVEIYVYFVLQLETHSSLASSPSHSTGKFCLFVLPLSYWIIPKQQRYTRKMLSTVLVVL